MKVVVVYRGGPADGLRQAVEVDNYTPYDHRTFSTLADEPLKIQNPANVSIYLYKELNGAVVPPEWVYEEAARVPLAEYVAWLEQRDESFRHNEESP